MEKFFLLSPQHRILLGLAVLSGYRSPEEVTELINKIVEYYGVKLKMPRKLINDNKRAAGSVKNLMSKMLVTKASKKQKGYLLEKIKTNRKYYYAAGQFTVDKRLSALILRLLERVSDAQNGTLPMEYAAKIAENDRELVFSLTENNPGIRKEAEWLGDEISKEAAAVPVLDKKFDYILKADYFREDHEAEGQVVPTPRLKLEEYYIEALVRLLPELRGI